MLVNEEDDRAPYICPHLLELWVARGQNNLKTTVPFYAWDPRKALEMYVGHIFHYFAWKSCDDCTLPFLHRLCSHSPSPPLALEESDIPYKPRAAVSRAFTNLVPLTWSTTPAASPRGKD